MRALFWAWLFIVVKDLLAAHYRGGDPAGAPPKPHWEIVHLRKHSARPEQKAGPLRPPIGKRHVGVHAMR